MIDHPARHILPASLAGGRGTAARWTRCRSRVGLGLELVFGVGCEVAIELVGQSALDLSVASGLGLEAAVAVGLGLVFGLRRL